jgi:anti-sigma factor RsiW
MKRMRRPVRHRCAQSDLSCYIDGELSDRRAARVAAHIQDCSDCAQELDSLQATVALLRATPVPGMPRSVVIPVSAVAAQRNARRVETRFVALRASTVALTVILAVLLSRDAFVTRRLSSGDLAYSGALVDSAMGEASSGPVALLQAAPQEEAVSSAEAVVAGAEPAQAVSARQALPEGAGAGVTEPVATPLAPNAELDAEGEAFTESAPRVAPLAAEPPAEAQSLSTEAAMPAAKAAGDSQLRGDPIEFWTPLRIASAALGGVLAALVGVLFTISRHRLTL